MFLTLARLNHACNPSAGITVHNAGLRLVALRTIEEVFVPSHPALFNPVQLCVFSPNGEARRPLSRRYRADRMWQT